MRLLFNHVVAALFPMLICLNANCAYVQEVLYAGFAGAKTGQN